MPDTPDEAQTAQSSRSRGTATEKMVREIREELNAYQEAIGRRLESLESRVSTPAFTGEQLEQRITDTTAPLIERMTSAANTQFAELERRVLVAETGLDAARAWMEEATARITALSAAPTASPDQDSIHNILARLDFLERQQAKPREVGPLESTPVDVAAMVQAEMSHQLNRQLQPTTEHRLVQPVTPRVHGKVLALMREVNHLSKDQQMDAGAGGQYRYRSIDDAMDAVGHAMRRVGLTMETTWLGTDYSTNEVQGTDRQGRPKTTVWTSARVQVRYTFIDPDDGSRHHFEMAGEARASDDKGTSKAATMALKYALLHALMIPVTGMPDGDAESPTVESGPAQDSTQSTAPAAPPASATSATAVARPEGNSDPQDTVTSRRDRARRALAAMRAIGNFPAEQRRPRLVAIMTQVEQEKLGSLEVDNATLRAHGAAIMQTLPRRYPEDPQGAF